MKKREAFTLIELIAVLVILAILALIVTPLVLNIIKKARTSADKRSIDAYGRSIELAIADYLLENGTFPTSIDQLTIEYTGDKVECTTTTLKDDGAIYLAECTVGGRTVSGYTYGKVGEEQETNYTAYSVGDIIQYNGVQYYVIKDSTPSESSVTLLKSEPLTYEEVQTYSAGTGAQIVDNNGIGRMQYHAESNNYETSYVKTTVDRWKQAEAPAATEARLATMDEILLLGYEWYDNGSVAVWRETEATPNWVYYSYSYWTMTPSDDSDSRVWAVVRNGLGDIFAGQPSEVVRPVIVLNKSVLN